MRDIKFKYWDNSMKNMVYSHVCEKIRKKMEYLSIFFNNCTFPENIMKYTGLKDKNNMGVELFRNDIVKTNVNGKRWLIIFKDYSWHFKSLNNIIKIKEEYTFKEYLKLLKKANAYIEYVGNKYENPELLEGK